MNRLVWNNCLIYYGNNLEDINYFIKLHSNKKNNILVKFSENTIILIIENLNLEKEQEKPHKKHSRVVINNIEFTKCMMKSFDELTKEDIEYLKSRNLMVIKNLDNGNFYILNKFYYSREKNFEYIEKVLDQNISKELSDRFENFTNLEG